MSSLSSEPLLVVTLIALLFGILRRTLFGWDAPLWFDETYTAAIAARPNFALFLRDALSEVGGTLYYGMMWAWAQVAGVGNFALRFPSLIFSLITPFWLLLRGHPDAHTRYIWAALTSLYIPSFYFASEARAYSFLFFLACVQLTLYMRLMQVPTKRAAFAFCFASACMILTHYHSLAVIGLQGLLYLWIHRGAALKTWAAALVFIPVLFWMSFHIPLHLRYARPENVWYEVIPLAQVRNIPAVLFGEGWPSKLFGLVALGLAYDLFRRYFRKRPMPYSRPEICAATASIAALAIIYGIGFIRPSFTPRYLIPYIPGLLFGVAIWAREWGKRWQPVPYVLLLGYLAFAAVEFLGQITNPRSSHKWSFSWERTVPFFASNGAQRLTVLWDNPTSAVLHPKLQAAVGGFFFERAGVPMKVNTLVLAGKVPQPDPNLVLNRLNSRPGDAVLWLYIPSPRTLAHQFPPRLSQLDPAWKCREFGRHQHHVIGCVRQGAALDQRRNGRQAPSRTALSLSGD